MAAGQWWWDRWDKVTRAEIYDIFHSLLFLFDQDLKDVKCDIEHRLLSSLRPNLLLENTRIVAKFYSKFQKFFTMPFQIIIPALKKSVLRNTFRKPPAIGPISESSAVLPW